MKESRMNMDNLSKPELLMLFSVLEGELEARDLVIEALRVRILRCECESGCCRYIHSSKPARD
ncbi:CT2NL protein, partial [Atractosteus spatula]|nr:CT2NL protein [Atractosteus spatula]